MSSGRINSKYKNMAWALISLALAVFTVNTVLKQSRTVSMADLLGAVASSDKQWLIPGIVCAALFVCLPYVRS